ncbi:FkbM family methyltransferase [Mycobacterium sp. pUA109]|uniref:FkbM family methyltransferase n=1 Tax=Mycobacterium sp. pUA109 TaxID=3238982 RepID=UPI00351B2371
MPSLDLVKKRGRGVLLNSMRTCVAQDRLPWIAKAVYVNGCQRLLPVLGVESDETPVESEYGPKFVAGSGGSWLNSILRYRGVWEPALSEFIIRHVHEGDVCVDAGANCGYFSLLLAQQVGQSGKVIAIEAAPDSVRRLRANVELNGAVGTVDVVLAACAQQKGEITLHVHPRNDCWTRLSPPGKGELDRLYMGKTWIPVTVPADTLGAIVGSEAERVSFIKLHIEGAEAAVAPEIPGTFPHPRLVVALLAKEPHIAATLKPFEEAGFYVYDRHNDYRWAFERKVQAITEASYGDFTKQHTAYVLLSRQPLTLS